MSKRVEGVVENVLISDITDEGMGLGKKDGLVYFVERAVPGDLVDVELRRKRSSWIEGSVKEFKTLSPHREVPFCPYFGTCGGCKWQHLSYTAQLKYKEKTVRDALERLGRIDTSKMLPILASEKTTFYRNKLEFTFSDSAWLTPQEMALETAAGPALGFHIPGRFDKILDIKTCFLQPDPSNEIRNKLAAFARAKGLTFYNLVKQLGFLRNLIIRTAGTGEVMVIVVFAEDRRQQIKEVLEHLAGAFPGLTSLQFVINTKRNDTINDQEVLLYRGQDHIFEEIEDLKFKVSAKSFYQTNSRQTVRLYQRVRELARLSGAEHVYDLYTGTGTIANFLARKAGFVTGMEYVPEAVSDALENSKLNGIANTAFFAGDIKDLLSKDFISANGMPDVIVTDPPRAGMHAAVVEAIKNSGARKLVYVSCNAATQARDLQMLSSAYCIEEIQPVDMFPHTQHVENIVYATRRREGP